MDRKLAVSRLQRDLSDSTTVRNVGVGLGYGLLAYRNTLTGLRRVHPNIELMQGKLNENWETYLGYAERLTDMALQEITDSRKK